MADRRTRLVPAGLLLALVVILVLSAALSVQSGNEEPFSERSVYNSQPSGYRAWFLTAEKAGVPVVPWRGSFTNLDALPVPATMVVVEPYTAVGSQFTFGEDDVRFLLDWVSNGNTLVFLDDFRRMGTAMLLSELALSVERVESPSGSAVPLEVRDADLAVLVDAPVVTTAIRRFESPPSPRLPVKVLLADAHDRPVMVETRWRQGHIILGTAHDLASNRYLHQPVDNYQVLTNLLTRERGPVFINEFVHGFQLSTDLFAYYRDNTPLAEIFVQLIFLFVFVFWLSLAPWRPRVVQSDVLDDQGPDLNAFIRSLAGVYYRHQAAPLVLAPQLARIEALMRTRYRMGPDELPARLESLLGAPEARYSREDAEPAANLIGALHKARRAVDEQQRLEHRELLRLSRRLTILEHRLKQGNPHVADRNHR